MARLSEVDVRRVRYIADQLRTLDGHGGDPLATLMPQLRSVLDVEFAAAFGMQVAQGEGLALSFAHVVADDPARTVQAYGAFLAEAPRRFGVFDALSPEAAQRNLLVTTDTPEQFAYAGGTDNPLAEKAFVRSQPLTSLPQWNGPRTRIQPMLSMVQAVGIAKMRILRVLVCDGPVLLANLYLADPRWLDGRERQLLRALLPAIHDRLALERQLSHSALNASAIAAGLDAVGAPAALLTAAGRIAVTNAAGAALLARHGVATHRDLEAAIKGLPSTWKVTRMAVPGAAPHWLAIARPPSQTASALPVGTRAARWQAQLGLSAIQTQVLALLAQGEANKSIAARLACAESTVEAHVTALLGRTGLPTRSELAAQFWRRSP